jgi:hypothetical protein
MSHTGQSAGKWRDDPDACRPVVLVIGGFLTAPLLYYRLARRLRARGAAAVVVAQLWTPDWIWVSRRGMGAVVTRAGRALLRASTVAASSPEARGAPILVVGHSAGGLTARLLTSPEPFAGRRLGAAGRIGAIVTLGSPHHVAPRGDIGGRISVVATAFADRVVPGAAFSPDVGYVSVASRAIVGRRDGDGQARMAYRFYRGLIGPVADEHDEIPGDGLVPVSSALLEGAERIVLDDAVHGQFGGRPWYGSEGRVDLWWPAALAAWHAALRARVELAAATTSPGDHRARTPVPSSGAPVPF